MPESQYVLLLHRRQRSEACCTFAHLSARQATERSAVYKTVDAEGGKVRSRDGSYAEGKFTRLQHSGYYEYHLFYYSKTLNFERYIYISYDSRNKEQLFP